MGTARARLGAVRARLAAARARLGAVRARLGRVGGFAAKKIFKKSLEKLFHQNFQILPKIPYGGSILLTPF